MKEATDPADVEEMDFDRLFEQISPEEIRDNVFTLAGKDLAVVTAGTEEHYNSMTASGGGLGFHLRKPAAWLNLRADRYTLELILKELTYTQSYFPNEYRKQMLFLGSTSGRDSEKMKEVELTSVRTPSGNMSFTEARLVLECRLTQLTTANPDDFYTQEARDFVNEAYREADQYRKLVFGEITRVWVKRQE